MLGGRPSFTLVRSNLHRNLLDMEISCHGSETRIHYREVRAKKQNNKLGRLRPNLGRLRPIFDRIRLNFADFGQISFGQFCADFGNQCTEVDQIRQPLAKYRQNSADVSESWVESWACPRFVAQSVFGN